MCKDLLDIPARAFPPAVPLRHHSGQSPEHTSKCQALSIVREHDRTTLVYAAKDPAVNHALILRDYIRQALEKEGM